MSTVLFFAVELRVSNSENTVISEFVDAGWWRQVSHCWRERLDTHEMWLEESGGSGKELVISV